MVFNTYHHIRMHLDQKMEFDEKYFWNFIFLLMSLRISLTLSSKSATSTFSNISGSQKSIRSNQVVLPPPLRWFWVETKGGVKLLFFASAKKLKKNRRLRRAFSNHIFTDYWTPMTTNKLNVYLVSVNDQILITFQRRRSKSQKLVSENEFRFALKNPITVFLFAASHIPMDQKIFSVLDIVTDLKKITKKRDGKTTGGGKTTWLLRIDLWIETFYW